MIHVGDSRYIGNLTVDGSLFADVITEKTIAGGVAIETVLIKDGLVDGVDISARDHDKYTDAEAIAAIEGEPTLDLAGDLTITVGKSLGVDTIDEKGAGTGVTIETVLIKDGLVDGVDISARDHAKYTDAEAIAAVEGEATLDLTGDVTIAVGKTLGIGIAAPAEALDVVGNIHLDGEVKLDNSKRTLYGSLGESSIQWNPALQAIVIATDVPRMTFSNVVPRVKLQGDVSVIQSGVTAAVPACSLKQSDQDETMFLFEARSNASNVDRTLVKASDFPTPGAITAWLKVEAIDSRSGGIPADHLYMALREAPTTPLVLSTFALTEVTATYTADENDVTIEADGTFTVTLPTAVGIRGKHYEIVNAGTGTITVDGDGSETINDESTQSLAPDEAMTLYSNNVGWRIS